MLFKLEKSLRELDITRNKLAVYAEVRPNTINDLANGDAKRIEIDTLEKILKSLNEISMTKGMPRTYNIEDILEYELTDDFINASKRRSIMSPDEFSKIKEILTAYGLHTTIKTLEMTDICEFLLIFGEYLMENGAKFGMKSDTGQLSEVNDTFLRLRHNLNLYGLVKYNEVEVKLTDKGIEFVQRLKDF
ncbi:helix-turn-helix transcriptional regulator [Paenibacillus sp. FSL P4-0176]|uniref:helix-turn-helix domain-containing protein n=1 Tax=Paenibacillus sp. FSL P4-0176 TaxID=2921631 RepID=UPI0030CFC23E